MRLVFRRQLCLDLTPSRRKANRACSKVRSAVATVFAGQKHRFGLFVLKNGLARAQTTIALANLRYNLKRVLWIDPWLLTA